jgi:DNA-binding transcriptional MerR regulator
MSNANSASIVYDPAQAAELLGVSASGLRRLAPIYESVFGELKRVGKGDEEKRSREWPADAIERLLTARRLTGRGKPYRTIEAALEAIRDGVETDTTDIDFGGRQAGADAAIGEALQVLLSEVHALRNEIQELKQGRELPITKEEFKSDAVGTFGRLGRRLDTLLRMFRGF